MNIEYVKYKDIDKTRWDGCIINSVNSLVYGLSIYLDNVCENWDALIADDYKAVMPLPWKSKFGIKYIYQPFFTQQLGVFFTKDVDVTINDFIKEIPKKFIKYNLALNSRTTINNINSIKKINYILPLEGNYDDIFARYAKSWRKNVRLSKKEDILLTNDISVDDYILFKRENMNYYLSDYHLKKMQSLLQALKENNYLRITVAKSVTGKELGISTLIEFNNRAVKLTSASTDEGKKKRVMYRLVDNYIKESVGKYKYFDFVGSMLKGVAEFNRGFGSEVEYYNSISGYKFPFL